METVLNGYRKPIKIYAWRFTKREFQRVRVIEVDFNYDDVYGFL